MKTFLLAFLAVAICGSCSRDTGVANSRNPMHNDVEFACEKEKLKTIDAISEIARFRRPKNTPFSEAERLEIQKVVETVREKEELVALAKITRALVKHTSGELECKDSVLIAHFEIAFWHSIELLAEDRSKENLAEMESLKQLLSIDGGDGYDWSTIVYRIPAP